MTKLNPVLRVVVTGIVIAQAVFSASAFAGSIVINVPPPKKLSYQEQGKTVELEMTLTDVKVSAAVKLWLDNKFGQARGDYPYMIDKESQTVTILVDRAAGQFEVVPISQLK
jgi:hypothetical protein